MNNRKLKIKIGEKAYRGNGKISNDYAGLTGTIFFCKCSRCKPGTNRVQFDGIANAEYLSDFNIIKCEIF